ncbi:MAG: helix-turn-helix domain-containing protein [Geminicoccaceae bacterium]
MTAETETLGLRLKPGAQIDERALSSWIGANDPYSLAVGDTLDEFCTISPSTTDILDCLKSGIHSVKEAASTLGMSTRTLQREIRKQTGVSPLFWMSLARVRRAGRRLSEESSAAETAVSCGYSDQAHLCRDIRRWFGVTPTCLVDHPTLLSQLAQTGYA